MKIRPVPAGLFETFALMVALGAACPATAQQIEPQRPSAMQTRGSLGQPFPGIVKDLEVIGPDRFALTISDRREGRGADRVQVYTPDEGLVGIPFQPAERTVFDVAAAPNGGYWALHYVVAEASQGPVPAAGLSLQRFDGSGKPVGAGRLVTASVSTDPTFDAARGGWVIPLGGETVAVAFTTSSPDNSLHALRLTVFDPDGDETSTETLERDLPHLPNVSFLPLLDGGAALGWGSGDPMGERLSLTTIEPDGAWIDSVQAVWWSSRPRGTAFNLRLVPVADNDELAAVFLTRSGHVWQSFDQKGVATSGVVDHGTINSLIGPLRLDGRRLAYLSGGAGWPARVVTAGGGEPRTESEAGPEGDVTAFAREGAANVVVAAVVPPRAEPTGETQVFSYLYRFRP